MHLAVLFLFTYYLPSSIMRNATFDEAASNTLDVVYAQLYRFLINLGSAVATVMATLLYATPEAAIALVIVGALWNLLRTLFYPKLNRVEESSCTVQSI
jgi:uncharacterized membrane protein